MTHPTSASGDRLCLSVDALEEGVHFRAHWQPIPELGRRLLATCLSDLAACGAEPLGYLLAQFDFFIKNIEFGKQNSRLNRIQTAINADTNIVIFMMAFAVNSHNHL